MSRNVAVVLSGCGHLDGSEITESVSVLIHLARHGVSTTCFAPDAPQAAIINHATGKTTASGTSGQTRGMLVESSRIARGKILPIDKLDPASFDALIFPGGFGAAKNLCTFAMAGEKSGHNCDVLPDVSRVIKAFHAAGKPIGLCCIAPVLAARVLGTRADGPGVTVTIGTDEATAATIGMMGAKHVAKGVTEAFTDEKTRVVTTPAYMFDADPFSVFTGVGQMVDEVVKLFR